MRKKALALLREGTVIPAFPLTLNADRSFNERRQRALIRYYLDAGVGGLAVAVHTTQFAIRDPKIGLFQPILRIAKEELREKDYASLYAAVTERMRNALAALREDVSGFNVSFDHRNAGKPLSEAERTSLERAQAILK